MRVQCRLRMALEFLRLLYILAHRRPTKYFDSLGVMSLE